MKILQSICFIFVLIINSFGQTNFDLFMVGENNGCIVVTSRPDSVLVYIDDKRYGRTPLTINDLEYGQHKIMLEDSAYFPWVSKFNVDSTSNNTVHALLSKRSGIIQVTSNIPGSMIYINGEPAAKTPRLISQLDSGLYVVTVEKRGYTTFTKEVNIKDFYINSVHAKLDSLNLYSKTDTITTFSTGNTISDENNDMLIITSKPEGANIFLESVFVGQTPDTLYNMDTTLVSLRIEKEGYVQWQALYNPKENRATFIHALLYQKLGTIQVYSDLPDVKVTIDGQFKGSGSKLYSKLELGEHEIKIVKENYLPLVKKIVLNDYDVLCVDACLTKSWVNVRGSDLNTNIYLNDTYVGKVAKRKVTASPGKSTIKLEKTMHESRRYDFYLYPQQEIEIVSDLKPKLKFKSIYSSVLFPGMGQFYAERNSFAILYSSLAVSGILAAFTSDLIMGNRIDDYNSYMDQYITVVNNDQILQTRQKINKAYDDIQDLEKLRNVFIGVVTVVWIVNIVDACVYKWPNIQSPIPKQISINPKLGLNKKDSSLGVNFKLTL